MLKLPPRFFFGSVFAIAAAFTLPARGTAAETSSATWTASWFTSEQLTEPHNMPPAPGLDHTTLRQFIYPTLSGSRLRLTLSNAFGHTPASISAVHIATAGATGDAIDASSDHAVHFHGQDGVVIQPGASMISDPVDLPVTALHRLAITMAIDTAPPALTGHPGSRTTSFFCPGDFVAAEHLSNPTKVEHWYFITTLDVTTSQPAAAVVTLGDSITDGRGSTTDENNRWPDDLARRLQANADTRNVAVLNAGIGGNTLLRGGLGPNVLSRFDRDVLAPAGVRWLIVFEGINDIGGRKYVKPGEHHTTADEIIGAYEQVIERAHAHGLGVIGTTITPYEGAGFYFTPDGEADRQKVNDWVRHSGGFDHVIDFDAIVRDPKAPTHLLGAYDSGDHLHPSAAGYEAMAKGIDLALFAKP